jgi:NADPH:quinone reductase-like Zn-dependent oxidoreductase
MKVAWFESFGGPEVLQIVDREVREPAAGEVLVRVTSVGLNRADLLFVQGRYFQKATLPSRVGMEPAGVVERAGSGAAFHAGDRVGVLPSSFAISAEGGIAEYVTVPASSLVATPSGIGNRDAGAIWMQYLTVWGAMKANPGEFVVITAASSSVGLAAIEMANASGAVSIATTTSADKVDRLKAHGAAHVIDVKTEDYGARIKDITEGRGVDIVFDAVGGPAMNAHVRACATGASIILYGLLDTRPMDCFPAVMIAKNLRLAGYSVRSVQQDPAVLAQAVREVSNGIECGRLKPVIDRHFPMGETRAAFEYMASNRQFGKIVINVWDE